MVDQLSRLSQADPEGVSALRTVDSWRDEQSVLQHPILWWRNQRVVARILRASPREARDYKRAWRTAMAWALLVMASLISACSSAWSVLTSFTV